MASRDADSTASLLREALLDCAATRLSGVLLVTGEPGGMIHLASGGVTAIQTSGAPGAEVILLRSDRVTESTWDAAFAAAAAAGEPMCAELVTRAAVGAGELEALLRTALADAMFVLANGLVEECHPEPGEVDCLLPLQPGAEAEPLLTEAARRMRVLATLPGTAGRERERVVAVPGAVRPGAVLGRGQDEILALADGRRTARDMAFAMGRGVYATLLQLAEMRDAGLLTSASPGAASTLASVTPDQPPARTEQPEAASGLPQRRKGRTAAPRLAAEPRAAADRPAPHRLLRPRSGKNPDNPA